jgi:ABC-type uncharacterized transport system substrate-binding protein
MRATTSVPIVVGAAADLVGVAGLKSLARPGGNVTGVTANQPELDRKRLEVLKGAVPAITRVAYVFSPDGISEEALVALEAPPLEASGSSSSVFLCETRDRPRPRSLARCARRRKACWCRTPQSSPATPTV